MAGLGGASNTDPGVVEDSPGEPEAPVQPTRPGPRTWLGSEAESELERLEKQRRMDRLASPEEIEARLAKEHATSGLETLPPELLHHIASFLTSGDPKDPYAPNDALAFRQTSPHLDRVFAGATRWLKVQHAYELQQALTAFKYSGITRLDLSHGDFEDRHIAMLAQVPTLESLNLGYNENITDAAANHLRTLPNLTALNLEACDRITEKAVAILSASTTIQRLCFRWHANAKKSIVPSLTRMKALKYVDLTGVNCIKPKHVNQLAKRRVKVDLSNYP
ncbi:hypothetical protein NCCP691_12230 [Noviherbaspirillum aridicola]|uniref:Leucine rich repeat (LRR) protein n=2 Tax=Noviherbaspirillum aridicola TaxID=2849687 RepID=A0ABQ4Q251_9BURK|nr:hypothetical protein NCCP691_12230 [Noviherbaspirillum aridicola]